MLRLRSVDRRIAAIALCAVITLGLLLYLLIIPAAHDPDWWKHVGIKHHGVVVVDDGIFLFGENAASSDAKKKGNQQQKVGTPSSPSPLSGSTVNSSTAAAGKSNGNKTRQFQKLQQKPAVRFGGKDGKTPFPLIPGVHYDADYDMERLALFLPEKKPTDAFEYVNPRTADYDVWYISDQPKVLTIPNFLTDEECDALVAEASPRMARSLVAEYKTGPQHQGVDEVRTSTQTWLPTRSGTAKPIVDRILKLTGFPPNSAEELQILRYELNQKYDAHNDYFDPALYGAQPSNRAVTVFWYLSTVEEGGETWFPRADHKGPTYEYKKCDRGLRVHPKKGTIALFYDMRPDKTLDDSSLHGGCPVKKGTKWGGTLWLRLPTPS